MWAAPLANFAPVEVAPLQFFGLCLMIVAGVGFTVVHFNMGDSWSPVPEVKPEMELVESGLFAFARHPMYMFFTWFWM